MSITKNEISVIIREVCNSAKADGDSGDKPLKDLGIDSLDLSAILLALEEKYEVQVPDEDMDKLGTINQIVEYLDQRIDK